VMGIVFEYKNNKKKETNVPTFSFLVFKKEINIKGYLIRNPSSLRVVSINLVVII